jgi:hypothetical protein
MRAHTNIVWFTGNSYPAPISFYEDRLAAFLDGGGRLFMTGQDILDQGAGSTDFVHDYLHILWDGSENQNDIATDNVVAEAGNVVTDGIGTVPLDKAVLGNVDFSDELTLLAPATVAFRDDDAEPDGLTVEESGYRVLFLAFPFEEFGTASDKADLMTRAFTWFGS